MDSFERQSCSHIVSYIAYTPRLFLGCYTLCTRAGHTIKFSSKFWTGTYFFNYAARVELQNEGYIMLIQFTRRQLRD